MDFYSAATNQCSCGPSTRLQVVSMVVSLVRVHTVPALSMFMALLLYLIDARKLHSQWSKDVATSPYPYPTASRSMEPRFYRSGFRL